MEGRVEELEIKVSFLEANLQDLHDVVLAFASRVEHLERELGTLRESLNLEGLTTAGHEKPPHY